jgi:hypothetical protein
MEPSVIDSQSGALDYAGKVCPRSMKNLRLNLRCQRISRLLYSDL